MYVYSKGSYFLNEGNCFLNKHICAGLTTEYVFLNVP